MSDMISREGAVDARRYTFGNDEFSLAAAYHDCKLVFDGITDDDSFQEADTGLILYYANEIIYALQKALEGKDIKYYKRRLSGRAYDKRPTGNAGTAAVSEGQTDKAEDT